MCLIITLSYHVQAKPKLESGDFNSILDENMDSDINEEQMQRMAVAAKLCLTQAARLRPNMSQVKIFHFRT